MLHIPFQTETAQFVSAPNEDVFRGGRDQFSLLPTAFDGIKQIGIIGWGSQGPAQAQNLRDSLKSIGSNIRVVVGLREGSKSISDAKAAGFSSEDGTLGEMYKVIHDSDLNIILISDAAQVENYPEIFKAARPGTALGFSHGFLEGFLTANEGACFPKNVDIIMVAPKGMGPSVRRLYLQGMETGGSGINSSMAVHQNSSGNAQRIAAGWSVGIGSPVTFMTTMPMEWRSDIFGERAILLGGLWGLVEALYDRFRHFGSDGRTAFTQSVLALTSFVSPEISRHGMIGFHKEHIAGKFDQAFDQGYSMAYGPFASKVLKCGRSGKPFGRPIG
ncbi:hypothetical protein N9L18_00650 [Candidatus Pacebacteria bacterium]|nr:hypothetical protein [Candidatus Paceibacterota bacterium]